MLSWFMYRNPTKPYKPCESVRKEEIVNWTEAPRTRITDSLQLTPNT